jgi:hypothetical protein
LKKINKRYFVFVYHNDLKNLVNNMIFRVPLLQIIKKYDFHI